MGFTRRAFLKNGTLAAIGTAALPSFLLRAAAATPAGTRPKRLVVIFQRGAADGLNIVIPQGDPAYYAMRPSIAVAREQVIDLDGFFGLHPSLQPLRTIWDQKHLAIVHAAGSPDPTRSHFDAQDYMESGTPGLKSTKDGWLNRALAEENKKGTIPTPFRAVALGPSLPRILSGARPAVALDNLNDFGVGGKNPAAQPLGSAFAAMYDESVDTVLHGAGHETFEAVRMLKAADPARYQPAAGADYPRGRFGDALRQSAQLLKADLGVQVAFTDIGGWDHHVNEGNSQGPMANLLREFAGALAAFWIDLGDLAEDTVIVTMSEFGRTAHENGNRGTDHGHGNVMMVLGGPVRGGKVYGAWPGLQPEQLHEGRDLAITTDFRRLLGEVIVHHMGNRNLAAVFPGFDHRDAKGLGIIG